LLFNYHPRFKIWGKDSVRPNLAGCARAEPFKRRKKMSTAKVSVSLCLWLSMPFVALCRCRSWHCSLGAALIVPMHICMYSLPLSLSLSLSRSLSLSPSLSHTHTHTTHNHSLSHTHTIHKYVQTATVFRVPKKDLSGSPEKKRTGEALFLSLFFALSL